MAGGVSPSPDLPISTSAIPGLARSSRSAAARATALSATGGMRGGEASSASAATPERSSRARDVDSSRARLVSSEGPGARAASPSDRDGIGRPFPRSAARPPRRSNKASTSALKALLSWNCVSQTEPAARDARINKTLASATHRRALLGFGAADTALGRRGVGRGGAGVRDCSDGLRTPPVSRSALCGRLCGPTRSPVPGPSPPPGIVWPGTSDDGALPARSDTLRILSAGLGRPKGGVEWSLVAWGETFGALWLGGAASCEGCFSSAPDSLDRSFGAT